MAGLTIKVKKEPIMEPFDKGLLIPLPVLRNRHLCHTAKILLAAIYEHHRRDGMCLYSLAALNRQYLGVTNGCLYKYSAQLRRDGYIAELKIDDGYMVNGIVVLKLRHEDTSRKPEDVCGYQLVNSI